VHLWRGCEADGYERWGPHAHMLCAGVDVRETEAVFRRSGWVVKQVTDKDGRFFAYRGAKLTRHIAYELGHAAVVRDAHALVWWGELKSWSDPPRPGGDQGDPCPECDAPLDRIPLFAEVLPMCVRVPDGGTIPYRRVER